MQIIHTTPAPPHWNTDTLSVISQTTLCKTRKETNQRLRIPFFQFGFLVRLRTVRHLSVWVPNIVDLHANVRAPTPPPEAFSCDLSVCLHVGFPRVGLFPWGLVSLNACFPLNRLVWLLSAEKPGFSLQTAQHTHRCFFSRFLLGSLPCSRSCSLFGALSLHVSCGNTNTAWRADYP